MAWGRGKGRGTVGGITKWHKKIYGLVYSLYWLYCWFHRWWSHYIVYCKYAQLIVVNYTSMELQNHLYFISPHLDRFNSFLAMLTSLRCAALSHFWLLPHSLVSLSEPGFSHVPPNTERSAYKDKQQSRLARNFLLKHIWRKLLNSFIWFYLLL